MKSAPAWLQRIIQGHESLPWRRRGFERDTVIDQLVARANLPAPVVGGPEESKASPLVEASASAAAGADDGAPPLLSGVPAEIPGEVPEVPEAALMRLDLMAVIKERVLAGLEVPTTRGGPGAGLITGTAAADPAGSTATSTGSAAASGLIGPPPTKIVVHGTGGVGKTILLAIFLRETPEVPRAFHRICWVPFGQTPNLPDLQRSLFRQLTGGKELSLPEDRSDKDAL